MRLSLGVIKVGTRGIESIGRNVSLLPQGAREGRGLAHRELAPGGPVAAPAGDGAPANARFDSGQLVQERGRASHPLAWRDIRCEVRDPHRLDRGSGANEVMRVMKR